jgi:hypothetical protein
LSGALKVYQRTSPRFTKRPSPVHRATRRTRLGPRAYGYSLQIVVSRFREFAAVGFRLLAHRG